MMIDIDKRSTNSFLYTKPSLIKRENNSNDRFDSLSNITIESRERNQFNYFYSLDFLQLSSNLIYPNIRIKNLGYLNNEKNFLYIFSNKLSLKKNFPLVYLGSEYFLRKSIDFEHLKYPLSTNEHLEPLIDLFLHRPQFIKEIPELNNLSNYRLLPQTISGLIFFDSLLTSSNRHLCLEFTNKENKNKFSIKDLLNMSQRENNIIQNNALNDQRYHALKNQLTNIYF